MMVFSRRSGFDARLGGGRAGFRQFGLLRSPFTPTVSAARKMAIYTTHNPPMKTPAISGTCLRYPVATALMLAALAQPALRAQETPATTPPAASKNAENDVLELDALVVTAVARPGTTKLNSSVSVSGLSAEQIAVSAPRSTAESFRTIPGIRSEATSGDANANITVRGAPISAGGSRYLQLQEDGLPLLQFGDIAFATSDSFLRSDYTVNQIEAIRGGSASTFASNSPGGVINFISKTGETAGGSLGFTQGLDYDSSRADFAYGSPIGDGYRFQLGGFYRTGEGPRDTGADINDGGQLKLNVTKNLANGYIRVSAKSLDDHVATYLPVPMLVSGSNSDPTFTSLPGFDKLTGTLNSANFRRFRYSDTNGTERTGDMDTGVHSKSDSLGLEASFDLGDGWTLTDRARVAKNSGEFVAPFPANVYQASASTDNLFYVNGKNAGKAVDDSAYIADIHIFNTRLNNFDNAINDLRLSKEFTIGDHTAEVTGGYYRSRQEIDMDWLWSSYRMEATKDGALVDTVGGDGNVALGTPAWGNTLHRNYDVSYDTSAPFASAGVTLGSLSLDASVREDMVEGQGSYASGTADADKTERVDESTRQIVNYDASHTSFSVGANYAFTKKLASFIRYSEGASASADRILFGSSILPDGSVPGDEAVFNVLKQTELGVKYQTSQLVPGTLGLFGTLFHAETTESNYELTSQKFTSRVYQAQGLELEAVYVYEGFDLRVGATFTDAEIDSAENAALVGNTPRRQADFTYHVSPTYSWSRFSLGGSVIGTTEAYAQDDNQLVFPSYAYVNGFASWRVTKALTASLNVNNLFNTFGLSEAEEGSIPASGIIRARGLTGRSVAVSLKYDF